MIGNKKEFFGLARVRSIDDEAGAVWVELAQGGQIAYTTRELPDMDVGDLLHVGMATASIEAAPADAVWPSMLRTIGMVKAVTAGRILIEIGGSVRVIDETDVLRPVLGGYFFFEDRVQKWQPLSDEESKILIGSNVDGTSLDSETDMSAFNVEHYEPDEGAAGKYGGMQETIDELIGHIEGNFQAMHQTDGRDADRAKSPAGAMFFGPPGTGKTHLARTISMRLGADLITVNGPELLDKYLGSTEKAMRSLFALARGLKRPIVFIDEFDTIGSRRGPDVHEAINRQVGQLLSLMDGAGVERKPFVIAATNRLEDVDPAFLRPGRFDLPIEFTLPNLVDRIDILQSQSPSHETPEADCIAWLAAGTDGWSPAELALIWTEADVYRSAEGRATTTQEDVVRGFDRAREQHAVLERAKDAVLSVKKESR